MDENTTTEVEETEVDETKVPQQLRDALKRQTEEAAKWKAHVMQSSYEQLKLDPDMGLGKAIAKEYEGDPTVEALASYAQDEYGYTPPVGEENPQAAEIANQQTRIDQAAVGAGSIVTPTEDDVLAKAEAERDNATTMAIKGQQVANMMRPRS